MRNYSLLIKKHLIDFMRIKISFILLLALLCCGNDKIVGEEISNDLDINKNIVSVIDFGIKNDGSPIGSEINDLVRNSYSKTLFFPAGTYNLTEPIILPVDYTKNVNIIFDKNALIKCDHHLEALLKVGFSEQRIMDYNLRRFSYIEGGVFDCYNADNGIIVNGFKQLVQLRSMSLVRGRKTHIRIARYGDFSWTTSSDTKIDNVTIHGLGSNDDIIGIYIDKNCHDCKISNTFIYATKQALVTKSAGHILNNIHILTEITPGGTDLGKGNNFLDSEGIRIETAGFFVLNQIYYDTVDKGIVISDNNEPTLMLDQNISYSYLDNFGTSFIYRDEEANSPLRIKLSNSVFTVRNKGFTIFDFNVPLIGWDVDRKFTFINCDVSNPQLLNPYDPALLQRVRNTTSDALIYTNISYFDTDWHVFGALVTSPYRSLLRIDLKDNFTIDLDLKFTEGDLKMNDYKIVNPENEKFELGYAVKGNYCVLLFRPKQGRNYYPIINDELGNGSFMPTPSKGEHYRPADYAISEPPIVLLSDLSHK